MYPAEAISHHLEYTVWFLASLGILYQQVFHERYKWLETTFYVFIALLPAYAVFEMVRAESVELNQAHAHNYYCVRRTSPE